MLGIVSDGVVHDEVLDPDPEAAWMFYEFCTAHPVLWWLPTKLAEWIGANLSDEFRNPDETRTSFWGGSESIPGFV